MSETNPPLKPIFLHGLWRSGSTYIWSRFRENNDTYCFYEPLHQGLGRLTKERITRDTQKTTQNNAHPDMAQPYFYEYEPLIAGRGVKNFKRRLSDTHYILSPDDRDAALEKYVATLVDYAQAQGKVPVLGFNRTGLRAGFLKRRFDSFDIHIDRDPRMIWASYQGHRLKNNNTFYEAWLLTIERNAAHPLFAPMAENLPLRGPWQKMVVRPKRYYRRALDKIKQEDTYAMVFHLWLACALHGLSSADLIFDMEEQNTGNISNIIKENTGIKVSFEDLNPPRPIAAERALDWEPIEKEVLSRFPFDAFPGGFDPVKIKAALPQLSARKAALIETLLKPVSKLTKHAVIA